ncbi:MAG TPA: hypothetical protein PKC24_16060, partial [Cyclobacteriaceae bacterium]|nr:hypothetical protein [Cyclobacteriaceae bacterium]
MEQEQETNVKVDPANQRRVTVKEFFGLGPVFGYFFRKNDPGRPNNINIRMMHGINKISILIFLAALVVMIVR